MMKNLLIISILWIFTTRTLAQVDCPEGYEERNVKCNGKIVVKCVPQNYTCNMCWTLEFAPCPGKTSGGSRFFSSYENALRSAQKESNNWREGKCSWYDNTKYKIYLDDAKFCSTTPNAKLVLKNDLLKKIKPFLQRLKDEIANYRRYVNGQPYKPGAVIKEYQTLLDQAEENARDLEVSLNNINDNNLFQIENAFKELQQEAQSLKQADTKFRNDISAARQEQESQQKEEEDRKRREQQLELQRRTQERIDAQMNILNAKSQARANLTSSIADGIGSIFSTIQANQMRKRIADDERRMERHFEELKRLVQSEEGELEDCSTCYGEGYKNCNSCSATGEKTCGVCYGKAGQTCASCNGTGTYQVGTAKLSCSACFGKGVKTCSYCNNSGKTPCINCNGLAKSQCYSCQGTGQAFKKVYSQKQQQEYTQQTESTYTSQPIDNTNNTLINKYDSKNIPSALENGITEAMNTGNAIKSICISGNDSYCLVYGRNGYITNALPAAMLNELRRCNSENFEINIAATYGNNGWVVVNNDYGYHYDSIPADAGNELYRCNQEKLKISIVAFTPTGGWVIVNGTNGYHYNNIPEELASKIKECNEQKSVINQIAFTPTGGWVLVFNNNGIWHNDIPEDALNALLTYNKNGKKISFISFTENSFIIR